MRKLVTIFFLVYTIFCIGNTSLSATEKKFTTDVLWQSFDNSGPKNPTISSVDWKIVDDVLTVCEVESGEWVKCIYLGQKTLRSGSLGIMHTGKLSDGRRFSLSLIKSGSKFYYSLATTRGQEEHITYGPCSDELKQYLANNIK